MFGTDESVMCFCAFCAHLLLQLAGKHGVGRIDIVENRYVVSTSETQAAPPRDLPRMLMGC